MLTGTYAGLYILDNFNAVYNIVQAGVVFFYYGGYIQSNVLYILSYDYIGTVLYLITFDLSTH